MSRSLDATNNMIKCYEPILQMRKLRPEQSQDWR